jgi:ribosomal protein L11 methyltransferase
LHGFAGILHFYPAVFYIFACMNYYQLKCPKDSRQEQNEILMALLAEAGFESFEETDTHLLAYIREADYSDSLLQSVPGCKEQIEAGKASVTFIPEQNWNAVWESNYPPVLIAGRCFIYAPFHQPKPEAEFNIQVHPKMAFGTAHHETTAQMIEWMLEEDFSGKNVLDMGCGTGVLAILACMKGARHADAVDNDPWSFDNTRENMALNHIENLRPVLGDATFLQDKKEAYDIILANINKNILLNDMPAYARALKSGGSIVFSGFYEKDLPDIKTKAAEWRLQYRNHRSRNHWVAAVFSK